MKLSGNANNSGNTEAFYTNLNNSSGNINQNISSQLSLLNKVFVDIKTMPLGKTQIKSHKCW